MIPFEGNEFLVLTQEKNDHLHELSVYVFLASDNWVKTLIVRCCFMFHYIMFHATGFAIARRVLNFVFQFVSG